VFILGGTDPFDRGPDRLATGLNEHGFAKVYTGTRFHANWFAKEARRVAAENPDARFAVVGRRGGAARAAELAAQLARDGLPIDAFVLLDPDGLPFTDLTFGTVPTTVFHPAEPGLEATSVSGVLNAIAARVPTETTVPVVLPLVDDPAPAPEIIGTTSGHSAVSRYRVYFAAVATAETNASS
jgi:pimeloyl-ACP methyl ester carboxylesterase